MKGWFQFKSREILQVVVIATLILLLVGLPTSRENTDLWPTEDMRGYCLSESNFGLLHTNTCCAGILPKFHKENSFICSAKKIPADTNSPSNRKPALEKLSSESIVNGSR